MKKKDEITTEENTKPENSTELAVTENNSTETSVAKTKKKTPRKPKTVDVSELPKVFTKTYKKHQLNKMLRHVYVAADKKFIKSLFEETGQTKRGKPLYSIPQQSLDKKNATQLKVIARDMRRQKGRIRWIPLAAVASVIALIAILFTTFKNRIIKNAIVDTCESIFEAKCDIDYVNFKLFDASLRIGGVQIANKKEPMKNLFSCDKIALDFDLNHMLRSRFITDEVAVTGMATNTDRKYSGDITAKLEAKKRAKAAKQDSEFTKMIKTRSNAALASIENSFQGLFDEYNPKNIIERCYNNLQSPAVAKNAEQQIVALIEKWKQKPAEFQAQYERLKETTDSVLKINLGNVKSDPKQIKVAYDTINAAIAEVEQLKKETEANIKDIQGDFKTIDSIKNSIQASVKHDTGLISKEIDKLTSINISDGQKFISSTLEGAGYQLLGKYYPYAVELVNYLEEQKNVEKKQTEKEKLYSKVGKRAKGKDIYWKANPPKFWIKKLDVSGFNFSFLATNISSDMDRVGQPAMGEFKIQIKDIDHTGTVVVDTRTNSKEPIVMIEYNCDRLPFAMGTEVFGAENIPGVPSVESSKSNLDCKLEIFQRDGFNITGTGILSQLVLTTTPFEPEFVSTIYQNTLANINSLYMQIQAGYRVSSGLNLQVHTDADKQFMNALMKELKAQLLILKKDAEKELSKLVEQLTGGAITDIGTFEDIYASTTKILESTKELENKLNAKKKEAESYLQNKIEETKQQAQDAMDKAVDDAKQKAKDSAKDYLNSLIKKN